MANLTPMMQYSKKQATVQTATYGSELIALSTAVERLVDLRFTLKYLGVPIRETDYTSGDNESVVNRSSFSFQNT